ncbi:hypothetical protein ACFS5J_02475 [Flavobacterium chuncheonense]|uniref:Lipoprotein n=1 Tax=Flavobacterium chuncheonense TaxID=2026653 RepID=A0ABW5YIR5_9FLAO
MKKIILGAIILVGAICSTSCSLDEANFNKENREEFLNHVSTDSIGDTGGQDGYLPTKP